MMKRHESTPAGGANRGGLWKNERGQFRLVWLWLAGFAIYALLNRGAEAVVALAMHRLNAYLNALATVGELQTPLWASAILDHYDPILSMVEGLMTIAVFLWLSKRFRLGGGHHHAFRPTQALRWMLAGVLGAVAGVAICLAVDSLRLERTLTEPAFSLATALLLPVCAISTMAGEVFAMDYLYESARLHISRWASILLIVAAEFVAEGGWHLHPIGMVNVGMQVLICCLMHDRFGLAAPLGLWFGWNYVLQALFVQGSGVWPVYHVSEAWLTGDGHLIFGGAWATLFMLGIVALLALPELRRRRRAHRLE